MPAAKLTKMEKAMAARQSHQGKLKYSMRGAACRAISKAQPKPLLLIHVSSLPTVQMNIFRFDTLASCPFCGGKEVLL
jgi:hypothetical protein